ncbi:MAG TPA: hypothetical protein VFC18_04880 [Burkholderiales bacterium]|nr:hypothetical protein [Burkholderiales bacterium]
MTDKPNDIGVLTALAQRMVDQRLPRALAMKERVDRGEVLSDRDVAFLDEVLEDARKIAPILNRNPKFEEAARTMARLYQEIMAKALENEKKA